MRRSADCSGEAEAQGDQFEGADGEGQCAIVAVQVDAVRAEVVLEDVGPCGRFDLAGEDEAGGAAGAVGLVETEDQAIAIIGQFEGAEGEFEAFAADESGGIGSRG